MVMSAGEDGLVKDFNRAVRETRQGCFSGQVRDDCLARIDAVAASIAALDGGLSAPAALKLEAGSIKVLDDTIRHAYESCTPGSLAQKECLDTADRIIGNIISLEGRLSPSAVLKLEEGFVAAYDYVVYKAYCGKLIQGRDSQDKYLAAADEITDRIVSLEGSLSKRAIPGMEDSLLSQYNKTVLRAYVDYGYEGGADQKKYLVAADKIADRIISLRGGLGEHAATGMKESLAGASDEIVKIAWESAYGEAQKRYLAVADEVKDKIASIEPTLPGHGNQAAKEPPALDDEVLQAIAVLNRPRPAAHRRAPGGNRQ